MKHVLSSCCPPTQDVRLGFGKALRDCWIALRRLGWLRAGSLTRVPLLSFLVPLARIVVAPPPFVSRAVGPVRLEVAVIDQNTQSSHQGNR